MPPTRWPSLLMLFLLLCAQPAGARELRVGMFPNITHAQALVAMDMATEGRCWFAQRVPGVRIRWIPFGAGPSAMEALNEKRIDLAYAGPGSVLILHARTKGTVVRVLSGALRGGSALVVHSGSGLMTPKDFKNKRIATPQFGNTQDIACRAWLKAAGLDVRLTSSDVILMPTANPDQLSLFSAKHVDAVWTVEPWVSLLEREAGGIIIHQPPAEENLTTVLTTRVGMLQEDPLTVEAFVRAHEDLTRWLLNNPEDAQSRIVAQLGRLNRTPFPNELVKHAWSRLEFDTRLTATDFEAISKNALSSGFLKGSRDINAMIVLPKIK